MNSIFHRVSIRQYEARPVEQEKIELLLRAAMAAPSAINQQPWEFAVVTNPELCAKLGNTTPYAKPAGRAPLVIVVCGRRDCPVPPFADIDLSAATENLLLEADELGLGAVWMGIAPQKSRMKLVEDLLPLPEHLFAFALIAVGYPAESRPQEERYAPARVHYYP